MLLYASTSDMFGPFIHNNGHEWHSLGDLQQPRLRSRGAAGRVFVVLKAFRKEAINRVAPDYVNCVCFLRIG